MKQKSALSCTRSIRNSETDPSSTAPSAAQTANFFFQAEDGIRGLTVTGVQTCALPIYFPVPDNKTWPDAMRYVERFVARWKGHRLITPAVARSEERRVGKEWRARWAPHHETKIGVVVHPVDPEQRNRPEQHRAVGGADREFFFSSRRRHTRFDCDWSSDVCSSDLLPRPRQQGVARRDALRRAVRRALEGAPPHHAGGREIGRASCRERVESSVGAAP